MRELFGVRADGQKTYLYTITEGTLKAQVTDFGATLVRLLVPDAKGELADVILGFEDPDSYANCGSFHGAIVGRNANRICNASFMLDNRKVQLDPNDNDVNNLHSGFSPYKNRMWTVVEHTENSVKMRLESPNGDQGFPGNAVIDVTYRLEPGGALRILYDGVSDKDTVFNMTSHTYFNMAGHDKPELAMRQILSMPARFFNPADELSIPTGECRDVANTPMDFRTPKAIGRDINDDYEPLKLQGGYDHNFEVFANPCAILLDPVSGRGMSVSTDCPGMQIYSGNFINNEKGKDGVVYTKRSGIALETQYFPDSVNHPEWKQPFVKAGEHYHSETVFRFWAE